MAKSEHSPENIDQQNRPVAADRDREESEDHKDLHRRHIALYQMESDEQLYQHLRCLAAKLGRPPTKADVPGFYYIKSRLGTWPRILEKAGLKPVSARRWGRLEQRAQARKKKSRQKEAVKTNSELP